MCLVTDHVIKAVVSALLPLEGPSCRSWRPEDLQPFAWLMHT